MFRETWVYNFGPDYLLRVVTLENGRVTDVDSDAAASRRAERGIIAPSHFPRTQ